MFKVNPKITNEEYYIDISENEYKYDPFLTQEEIDSIVQKYYALEK